MKRNWQNRRKKEGKPTNKPNIVMGSEIHVRRLWHCTSQC
jgi:glutamate/tyrosine decarboxylase-like PLP-dependent enzyme